VPARATPDAATCPKRHCEHRAPERFGRTTNAFGGVCKSRLRRSLSTCERWPSFATDPAARTTKTAQLPKNAIG